MLTAQSLKTISIDAAQVTRLDNLEFVVAKYPLPVQKKIIHVVVELLQNIRQHSDQQLPSSLTLTIEKNTCNITSTNIVGHDRVSALRSSIDEVINLSENSRITTYRKQLQNNPWSPRGTAGLGFLSIAQKAKGKIRYAFEAIDNYQSRFYFQAALAC